jgi:hypothetical protein
MATRHREPVQTINILRELRVAAQRATAAVKRMIRKRTEIEALGVPLDLEVRLCRDLAATLDAFLDRDTTVIETTATVVRPAVRRKHPHPHTDRRT